MYLRKFILLLKIRLELILKKCKLFIKTIFIFFEFVFDEPAFNKMLPACYRNISKLIFTVDVRDACLEKTGLRYHYFKMTGMHQDYCIF